MTPLELICFIGALAIFVLVARWCINQNCRTNKEYQESMHRLTEGKFPYMWKQTQPTVDTFVMKKLNELEQEIKELRKELDKKIRK